jgi:ABC-type uncharacterized transport system substrate-binding protein
MRRRTFIRLLGGGAVAAWPLSARAQQPAMPMVGFLRSTSLADAAHLVTAFRQGLKEAGFVEGQNVTVDYRSAEYDRDRLTAIVTDFVNRPAAVIVGNSVAALAAKAATKTVPVVFALGGDAVRDGFVGSLNRPGGNVTGVVFIAGALGAKRLELLRQLVPKATTIALLVNPEGSDTGAERHDVLAAAQAIDQQILALDVRSVHDLETAFATMVQRGAGALFVGTGPFMTSNRQRLVALAARHAIPASYNLREFIAAGGLMSYGTSITDAYRQAGVYAGRILKGEKPGDLPVVQSTKFEFVLNLKTAKTLGLDIPPTLLALADEVIE